MKKKEFVPEKEIFSNIKREEILKEESSVHIARNIPTSDTKEDEKKE